MHRMIFFLLLTVSSFAFADDGLMLGVVKQIKIQARGFQGCPDHVTTSKRPGGVVLTLRNSCGCMELTLEVSKVVGGETISQSVLADDLGEYCRPEITVSHPVAVFKDMVGKNRILPIIKKEGEGFVDLSHVPDLPAEIEKASTHEDRKITIPLEKLIKIYSERH